MENTLQSYALALLTLMEDQEGVNEDNPPLGWACHWEITSIYKLAAHRLLRALIEHPPFPEANQAVAQQFMTELLQCENATVIELVNSLNDHHSISPVEWAAAVHDGLSQSGNVSPLTNLAASYLNNLVLPVLNPAGKGTPTSSQSETPHITDRDNNSLLESATVCRNQAALKELVLRRDGTRCLISGFNFVGTTMRVLPICAHIIPFSVHSKMAVHAAIEMFTGNKVNAAEVLHFINHPRNAINMDHYAHLSLDQNLAWGIEAILVNNEWKYKFRVVRPDNLFGIIQVVDGDEIQFGQGDYGNSIGLPDPRLCNLHLAIARVSAASGFAEMIDRFLSDGDDQSGEIDIGDELLRRLLVLSHW